MGQLGGKKTHRNEREGGLRHNTASTLRGCVFCTHALSTLQLCD